MKKCANPACGGALPKGVRSSRRFCCRKCSQAVNARMWREERLPEHLWKLAAARARRAGVLFDITPDDIVVPELCPVLKVPLNTAARGRGCHHDSPSLDRIVPELGYIPGNVRVISGRSNILKRDASLEELEAVVAYLRESTCS